LAEAEQVLRMDCKFASRLAGFFFVVGIAVVPPSLNSAAFAGFQRNDGSQSANEVAARIAANYDCGGRRYYDAAGQFYEFAPGWDYGSGYWVGPISRQLVLRQAAHWRCRYRTIARYIVFGRRPHTPR
jgi:hypothetical protein